MDDALRDQLREDAESDRQDSERDEVQDLGDAVREYAFTFGNDHIWPLTGLSMFKNYVVIKGDYFGARNEMHRRFGGNWAAQYPVGKTWFAMVEEYELAELRLENLKPEGYRYDL